MKKVLFLIILLSNQALASDQQDHLKNILSSGGVTLGSYVVIRSFSDRQSNLLNILAATATAVSYGAIQAAAQPKNKADPFIGSFAVGVGLSIADF